MTEVEITRRAKELGIKLTNAEFGSEICEAWSARVALAARCFDRGDIARCQEMIDEANRYAI